MTIVYILDKWHQCRLIVWIEPYQDTIVLTFYPLCFVMLRQRGMMMMINSLAGYPLSAGT